MQLDKIREDMANHIVAMSKVDGFKDYARQRLKELSQEPIFDGIIDMVKTKLENEKWKKYVQQ